jgi:disulfide bond formation protein DsbB
MVIHTESDHESRQTTVPAAGPANLVWPALVVALVATMGSLWLSVGMGLKACPLCFYQRTFAMSILGVLGIGLLTGTRHRNVLNALALPLAVGGFGVAAFHVYLELTGKLECPSGVMGIGTAPQQSLAIFLALLLLVAAGVVRAGIQGEPRWTVSAVALLLGLLFAVGAVVSVPAMPPPPSQPYPSPLEICRPPFNAPS